MSVLEQYRKLLKQLHSDPSSAETLTALGMLALAIGEYALAEYYSGQAAVHGKGSSNTGCKLDEATLRWVSLRQTQARRWELRRQRDPVELIRIAQLALYTEGRVLVMGSGSADLAIACAMAGREVYAVDDDPLAVEIGRAKAAEKGVQGLFFRNGSLVDQGLPAGAFDTVVLDETLDAAEDPTALLLEARRLVRPGGHVLVVVRSESALPSTEQRRIWKPFVLEQLLAQTFGLRPIQLPGMPPRWFACAVEVPAGSSASDTGDVRELFLPPINYFELTDQPLVSVVIPTYNRAHFLEESVGSWLQQSYQNIEVIVIDDGSTDNTLEVLEQYRGRIKVISQPNRGTAAAVNRGLELASGKYFVFFGDDDVALPQRAEVQVRFLENHPDVDFVYSAAVLFSGSPTRVLRWFPAAEVAEEEALRTEVLGNVFHGATITLKTDALRTIGGMDSSLVRAQDYDAWLRLLLEGFRPAPLDVWVALHRIHRGPRGTAAVPLAADMVMQRTLIDEQRIFRKLWPRLALDRLVPRLSQLEHPALRVEALLIRTLAMAMRGLVEEAKKDLTEAASTLWSIGGLPTQHIRLLQQVKRALEPWTGSDSRVNELIKLCDSLANTLTS